MKDVIQKLVAAQRCRPNAVQTLIEEAIELLHAGEPVAEIVQYKDYDGDIYKDVRWKNGGIQNFNTGDKLYLNLQASEPAAQRITEQDAREICSAYNAFRMQGHALEPLGIINKWLRCDGKNLLAKLNEHREPVQAREPVYQQMDDKSGMWMDVDKPQIESARFARFRVVYLQPQVTPNKAEVPSHIEADPIGFVDANADAILSRGVKGGYIYWGDAPPLPLLKGDDTAK